ncbi:hypothetical protein HanIR_Chr13g0635621 [Helianthus annuus]|nr:hypothetical protein HanIR_Chr13g0635621 [Helianthus annuus]
MKRVKPVLRLDPSSLQIIILHHLSNKIHTTIFCSHIKSCFARLIRFRQQFLQFLFSCTTQNLHNRIRIPCSHCYMQRCIISFLHCPVSAQALMLVSGHRRIHLTGL